MSNERKLSQGERATSVIFALTEDMRRARTYKKSESYPEDKQRVTMILFTRDDGVKIPISCDIDDEDMIRSDVYKDWILGLNESEMLTEKEKLSVVYVDLNLREAISDGMYMTGMRVVGGTDGGTLPLWRTETGSMSEFQGKFKSGLAFGLTSVEVMSEIERLLDHDSIIPFSSSVENEHLQRIMRKISNLKDAKKHLNDFIDDGGLDGDSDNYDCVPGDD